MRWDDLIFTGMHGRWSWVVVRAMIPDLRWLIVDYHANQRLCITAFDSGPITPGPEERAVGWTVLGDVMVSPPLTRSFHIPSGEYDEWYVFQPLPISINAADCYVKFLGFNLADPRAMAASQDPTWDPRNYDWLVPIQDRFWSDLERLAPTSYIASGESDIVVSRDPEFVRRVVEVARESVG